jgi:drug/metabolite transporter (DMT)-like permease
VPTPTARAPRSQVVAALAAVYLVWGSTYLAIRYAVQTLPPFLMGGVRFLVAGAVLYAVVRRRVDAAPTRAQWGWSAVVGLLLLGFGNGFVAWAEQRVASGTAALLVATVALWVVLLDWLRPGGRRPPALVLLGVLLGLAGVATLVGPEGLGAGGAGSRVDLVGALALVVASLSWAAGSLLARTPRMPRPMLLGAAMQMITGGVWLLVLGLVTGEAARLDLSAVSGQSLLAVTYLVVFGSLVGYTAFIWLVGHVAPAVATTYAYVNPMIAVLLGWAIAGEPLDARIAAAAAAIVGAVALVSIGQARQRPPAVAAERGRRVA